MFSYDLISLNFLTFLKLFVVFGSPPKIDISILSNEFFNHVYQMRVKNRWFAFVPVLFDFIKTRNGQPPRSLPRYAPVGPRRQASKHWIHNIRRPHSYLINRLECLFTQSIRIDEPLHRRAYDARFFRAPIVRVRVLVFVLVQDRIT